MKIFITGIAGFLGSHLAQALIKRGDEVHGNDDLSCGDRMNVPVGAHFRMFKCQDRAKFLEELEKIKPDVLVHAAALAHEGLSVFSPHFITRSIFEASLSTFSAAISAGVGRIVYMSSMSRYGDVSVPYTEDMICNPQDPYAVSKLAAENCLRILCDTHGVKWTIAIPHSILGIRQKYDDPARNVASIMINRCLRGDPPIIYGDGQQKRCFSPVSDCIPSLLKMIDGDADYQVVNIGPDKGEVTIEQLARKIIKLTGFTGKPMYLPERPCEVKLAYCSSEKARELLGYKEQSNLDDCLAEMVEYIRNKGPKPFDFFFPLEIMSEKTPVTWKNRIM